MTRIAFLGLGAMGSRMAANLLAAGHDLNVWNRTPDRAAALAALGARAAATPRQAAGDADIVIAMLRDDDASRMVWTAPETGALAAMPADAIGVECSTLSLAWTRQLAATASERGIAFVDAPLAGSRPQAEAKALIVFAGGTAAAVERIGPVLRATAAAIHHAGPAGTGMAVKLAVNTLFAAQVAALAELLETLRRSGVDPARAMEIIGTTPVCAPAAKAAGDMMLRDAFAPLFPIDLAEKDLGCAALAAGDAGKAPLTGAVRALLQDAIAAGFGHEHITALAKLYRR
jgi:3-hydroxyisobutyrate dehydrogenase